ncbi:MAG: hypothetical protein MJ200_01130 [Mycoplasmoidaceae bacterium]|nr:hypothetical protein [Mycoplasmoidaceae bacterium]
MFDDKAAFLALVDVFFSSPSVYEAVDLNAELPIPYQPLLPFTQSPCSPTVLSHFIGIE